MPRRKKFTAEQIIGKLREAEVGLAQGKTVPEVVRKLGVTEQTYYRWKREYGGLRTDQAKRLKDLEKENARLRRRPDRNRRRVRPILPDPRKATSTCTPSRGGYSLPNYSMTRHPHLGWFLIAVGSRAGMVSREYFQWLRQAFSGF
jgi:putative transposase